VELKIEKHIDIKGKEGKLIAKAISDVIREFEERDRISGLKRLRIFVTKHPVETCEKIILPNVKLRIHGEMREWICQNTPSFSYWREGQVPTIMLDAHEKIFKTKNYDAIKGIFAHELMHLLDKLDGIEKDVGIEAEKAARNIFSLLIKHKEVKPFTKDRLLVSLVRVTTTGTFLIKDVLANTRAMSFGFDGEIYANYKTSLSDVKKRIEFNDKNILKALRKDKKHVLDDAFLTYLGLNVSWITFKMFHNQWYKNLQDLCDIKVPSIVKKNADPILKELLKLRSASDKKQIGKILKLTQQNYFNVVQHYCKKLR
jgi:hypothetical protein